VKIALIDYGAGNLASVRKAFAALDAPIQTPRSPEELSEASALIVPGVGHFGATRSLEGPWRRAIEERLTGGALLFGICLGMQWLFEGSTEAPEVPGLGRLAGTCARLDDLGGALKVPHVGWNALAVTRPSPLLDGVADASYVYFTHSYAAPVTGATIATTRHGSAFAAVVESENVMGVQFHPEKSGDAGLRILANFVRLARAHARGAEASAPAIAGPEGPGPQLTESS
jgi:imidazole glycerol-phosphate synthase subunit HisH